MIASSIRIISVLTVLFVNLQRGFAYSVPEPTWEILDPRGFRVSIPDDSGIALFAFHGSISHPLVGITQGDFYDEILQPTNNRWVYENTKISLERGTTVYYWIHVQHLNRGYRLLGRNYTVPGYSQILPTARPTPSPLDRREEQCILSKTTVQGRNVCQGELIFEDNFDILNLTKWTREVRIPLDTDDAEFVSFQDRRENSFVSDGQLYIDPTRLSDVPGYDANIIRTGELDLGDKCTAIINPEKECKRIAGLFRVLPPIVSARFNTKNSFWFRYGRIEIRAKLPKGDWLFPVITLDPQTYNYGISGYASGQIRVAFIRGNPVLFTKTGEPIDGTYLAGGVVLKTGEENRDRWLKKVQGPEHWGNKFHTYTLIWTDTSLEWSYDGNKFAQINGGFGRASDKTSMTPFDKEFHITLGVSAGGISDFPDESQTRTYIKPWGNTSPRGELNFFKTSNLWYETWDADSSLIVDYVKVIAL